MIFRIRAVSFVTVAAIVAGLSSVAEAARRVKKQEDAAPVSAPGDKRDRTVALPGSPFNGRAFWLAGAQCGGIYFRLNTIYAEGAITAKITKPDPVAFTRLSKDADGASATATLFFEMAERLLIADRKLNRDEAVLAYDPAAQGTGDRLKTAEAVLQAAKPCPELYKACHAAFPQICPDSGIPTN